VTSLINDGGAQIGAVYIHDLWLQPDVAYDEALNFDGNSGSNGTIENVRIHTVDFTTGMRINGRGWQIKDCIIEADDTALIIHADATEINISNLYTGTVAYDDYAVIILGDRNTLHDSVITRGLHVVGDDNLIEDNLFAMRVATGAGSADAISISGDRNTIEGNKVVQVSGTVLDGVDVKSGATGNIIGHNDLVNTTTPIRDDGTGTVLPPGVYRDWTPAYTNLTVGNGTVVARHTQNGNLVDCYYELTFGTTTVMGTNPTISTPVSAASTYTNATDWVGGLAILDTGTTSYFGVIRLNTVDRFEPLAQKITLTYLRIERLTSAIPMTWATGDVLSFTATFEAAA
jgi:hypothetical protein